MASPSKISSSDDRLNTELIFKHISDLDKSLSQVRQSVSQFDSDNYRLCPHVDASRLLLGSIKETFTALLQLENHVRSTFLQLGNDVGGKLDQLHTHVNEILGEINEASNGSNPAELIQTRIRNLTSDIIDLNSLLPSFDRLSSELSQAKRKTEEYILNRVDPSSKSLAPHDPGRDLSSFNSENFSDLIGTLDERSRQFLSFFSVFPINAVVSKRVLKNWWIGEGLLGSSFVKAEIVANKILEELMVKCFIEAVREQSRLVGFKLHPYVRPLVIRLASYYAFFAFDAEGYPSIELSRSSRACLVRHEGQSSIDVLVNARVVENLETLFCINEQYLDFKLEFFLKLKNIKVLSLGKWQRDDSRDIEMERYRVVKVKNSQNSYHHFEVGSIELMKFLKKTRSLRLLSLRGISRINELPESLCKQVDLRILDLNSCYNLEDLPQAIGNFKKLTYLDLSGCYLLDRMPKGMAELTELSVLKGFLVVNLPDSCSFLDLNGLKKLRKLSIFTTKENFPGKEDLDVFQKFEQLQNLSIIWNIKGHKLTDEQPKEEQTAENPVEGPVSILANPMDGLKGISNTSDAKDDKRKDTSAADPSNLANRGMLEDIAEKGENSVTLGSKKKALNVEGIEEECGIAPEITMNQQNVGDGDDRLLEEEAAGSTNSGVGGDIFKQEAVASRSSSVSLAGAGASKDVGGKTSASLRRRITLIKAVSRIVSSKIPSKPSQEVFKSLKKLDIQFYPWAKAPEWLKPDNMNSLKRLYIRGGKLKDWFTIQKSESWKVEILRLKYLEDLALNWKHLQASFPDLIAVEKVECPNIKSFPTDKDGLWPVRR